MTPLCSAILKDYLNVGRRKLIQCKGIESNVDYRTIIGWMNNCHCFEITDVLELVVDLANKIFDDPISTQELAFLPGPHTWLEFFDDGLRRAYLIVAGDDQCVAKVVSFAGFSVGRFRSDRNFKKMWVHLHASKLGLYDKDINFIGGNPSWSPENNDRFADLLTRHPEWADIVEDMKHPGGDDSLLYAALAMINSPRSIGRTVHPANRALERKITSIPSSERYAVNAWTEIKLEVSPPKGSQDYFESDGALVGRRALH
ncbi:MAG: hypothetical protein ABL878_20345, partial [Burkholderiales bacterium]